MATYVPLSRRCWVQGQDSNLWPPGYEPDELPNCSTLLYLCYIYAAFAVVLGRLPPFVGRGPPVIGEMEQDPDVTARILASKFIGDALRSPCPRNGNSATPWDFALSYRTGLWRAVRIGYLPSCIRDSRIHAYCQYALRLLFRKESGVDILWISYVKNYNTRYCVCQGPKTQFFKNFSKYCVSSKIDPNI